jgi:chemotaxis protein MotB
VSNKSQPIIIVKKKVHHGGHHGGAWKVAYADFVTAMMAFFLVMWLVGQSQEVKSAVAGYFNDPVAFAQSVAIGVLPGGAGVDNNAPGTPTTIEAAHAVLEAAAEQIRQRLNEIPSLSELRDQVEFSVTPEGLRIELVDADESSFFSSGSSVLRGESNTLLGVIGRELSALDNEIVIEGYTDSTPYASGARYTNWELSADRANAARRSLEQQGLAHERIASVIGHADRLLRHPDEPSNSGNRRVSILVRNFDTSTAPVAAEPEPEAEPVSESIAEPEPEPAPAPAR